MGAEGAPGVYKSSRLIANGCWSAGPHMPFLRLIPVKQQNATTARIAPQQQETTMMFTSITMAVVVPLIVNRFADDTLICEGIGADDGF